MPDHLVRRGRRIEAALRPLPRREHQRLVAQGEELPGQGVDDNLLSADFG